MQHSSALSSALDERTPSIQSGTYILSQPGETLFPTFHPVASILSSLPRPDLLVLSAKPVVPSGSQPLLNTLPVSPYPAQPGTPIRAHFVMDSEPNEAGWHPWVGGLWSKWVRGTVLGYRDFAGREAKVGVLFRWCCVTLTRIAKQPGTYDALSHLLFEPLPTPGSSGGPIVDEESGAVVGVILGTRMDNRVECVRGWGVPSEMIYEV